MLTLCLHHKFLNAWMLVFDTKRQTDFNYRTVNYLVHVSSFSRGKETIEWIYIKVGLENWLKWNCLCIQSMSYSYQKGIESSICSIYKAACLKSPNFILKAMENPGSWWLMVFCFCKQPEETNANAIKGM